jgi:predicted GIY-YIG superfamily endonuclease
MNVYAIELESNKYYIGRTSRDVSIRFEEHKNDCGSQWTAFYKPIKIIEHYQSDSQFEEDILTKKYMMKYGIDNVRGGSYTKITLDDWQIKSLEHEFKSVSDCCYKCGEKGHFANTCPSENFQGTNEELEEKIKDLEAVQNYIINIKPHQYVSSECIKRCLYEGKINYFNKSIQSLICVECPECNKTMRIERDAFRTSKKDPEYLIVCEKCDIYGEYVLKNTKVTLSFLENLPRNHCIKNGELSGMQTNNLTDNEYKIHIYKTFVNNSKLEKKYNKLLESVSIKFKDDKELIEYIDNMLVKLWRQMAQRY